MKRFFFLLFVPLISVGCQTKDNVKEENKMATENKKEEVMSDSILVATMNTNMGTIKIELFPDKAPVTVKNFISYVNDSFYDGTIFHRVINNFMIQGGGFLPDGTQKETKAPITLESNNNLSNTVGTIAMARTNEPNSATSQFFINVKDNDFLNYKNNQNPGYAVFGKVVSGMDVVNAIKGVQTTTKGAYQDWPVEDVKIINVKIDKEAKQ